MEADRFSTCRLGGLLPLASEFPLSLPGYYYQEIMLGYACGVNAIRTHGRGADSLGLWMELDLKQAGCSYQALFAGKFLSSTAASV